MKKETLGRFCAATLAILMIAAMLQVNTFATENETVRVGVFAIGNFCYFDDNGVPGGYYPDYVNKINEYTHWNIEYVQVENWRDAVAKLDEGLLDLIAPAEKTAEREEIYLFSAYSMSTELGAIYTLPDRDDLVYDDYETLSTLHFGAMEGSPITTHFLTEYSKTAGFKPNVTIYPDMPSTFAALYNGEVDAIATNIMLGTDAVKMIGRYSPAPVFFISRTDDTSAKYMDKLDGAMTELRLDNPTFENNLFNKYFEDFRNTQFTQKELNYIASLPEIPVGYVTGDAPLSYTNSSGEFDGVTRDLLDKISSISGIKFRYVPLPTTGVSDDYIRENQLYVMSNVQYNDINAENKSMHLSRPYFSTDKVMVAKDGLEYDSQSALTIALCSGSGTLEQSISQEYPNFTFLTFDSVEKCFDAVNSGQADASLQNRYVAETELTNTKFADLNVLLVQSMSDELCLALIDYQDGTELCRLLNNGLFISVVDKCISQISTDELNRSIIENTSDARHYAPITLDTVLREHLEWVVLGASAFILSLLCIAILFTYARVMRKQKDKIAEEDAGKSEFFSRMSHDMRTPMNGVLGMIRLSQDSQDLAEIHENMVKAESAGVYMLSLINDTLDLQRMETKKLKLERNVVNVTDYYDSIFSIMKVSAEQKQQDFRVRYIDIDMNNYIEIDAVRLKQILSNLISNAIKFTPAGGTVEVTVESLGQDKYVLHRKYQVKDTGVGMSEDFICNRLFIPYAQENNELSTQLTGSGLGMAITKNLVELMGGRLEVDSELGEGTIFTVYLDIKRAAKEEIDKKERESRERAKAILSDLSGKKILLCEDHPLNAEIARKLLAKVSCKVEWAKNGKLGVEQFSQSAPREYDAILMDIRMPVMDGIAAAKAIRELARADAKTIPILAMTANAYDSDIKNCLDAGMNAHIAKPIDPQQLYAKLDEFIAASLTDC